MKSTNPAANRIRLVKKHLGISKQELILLATYKRYNMFFEDTLKAVDFVMEKIESENDGS